MALFRRQPEAAPASTPGTAVTNGRRDVPDPKAGYYDLKNRIHRQLIERLDLTKIGVLPVDELQQQIRRVVEDMLVDDETPLSRQERDQIIIEVQHETFGLGPIEPLMQDPSVSDVLVNGPKLVYVERRGKLERT